MTTENVVCPRYPHYLRYLDDLWDLKDEFDVQVYAYCLMTNHVHLLLSPGESVTGMGRLMKVLAARATRYRNKLERRSGTLWESRFKSSPVQTDQYLLACCRYIELNPVRARMVSTPDGYRWSSFRQRMGMDKQCWIDSDPCYLGLAQTEAERRKRYNEFMREAIPDSEWSLIRQAVQRGQLTGDGKFVDEVERILGCRVEFQARGKPSQEAAFRK